MTALQMVEHFRCDRLRIKLSRATCATRHTRDNGADRKGMPTPCTGCPIGLSHKRWEPHPDAPAIGAPIPAGPACSWCRARTGCTKSALDG